MAKVSYETLFPDILPVVPACPDSLIERNIRSAVIEFCEKTGIYQAELDPLTTVSGIYEYDLEPPSGTVVHKIMNTVFDGKNLEAVSPELLDQRKPDWRKSENTGSPETASHRPPDWEARADGRAQNSHQTSSADWR